MGAKFVFSETFTFFSLIPEMNLLMPLLLVLLISHAYMKFVCTLVQHINAIFERNVKTAVTVQFYASQSRKKKKSITLRNLFVRLIRILIWFFAFEALLHTIYVHSLFYVSPDLFNTLSEYECKFFLTCKRKILPFITVLPADWSD